MIMPSPRAAIERQSEGARAAARRACAPPGEHEQIDCTNPRQRTQKCREAERDFSSGERVQFTAPYRDEHIANRQLGTVEQIDSEGNLQIRMDSGRDVQFNVCEHHLDYGYPSPAKESPPIGCWCTWTPTKPTSSLSIHAWLMCPCRAGGTMPSYKNSAQRPQRQG